LTTLTTLYSFCMQGAPSCTDGALPYESVLQASDQNLYGTTYSGGTGTGCAPGSYTTPANLTWSAGSTCTMDFIDPQSISGVEYEFVSSTINGSGISHESDYGFLGWRHAVG